MLLSYFHGKKCVTLLLSYLINLGRVCLFVFNIKSSSCTNVNTPEVNPLQAEGNVNSRLYSRGRRSN